MSGYLFNGIKIANLIQSGNSHVPGFNITATPVQYSSGFDKPANFSYTYQLTDISNYTAANMFVSSSNTNSGNIPLLIPNTSNSYFNYVSVCGCGGGGGGGGGGNYYELDGVGYYDGGNGGSGGAGAYGAVLNYPVSGHANLSYNIGTGGSGENGTGSKGFNTSVSVSNTPIISCPGGNGGSPGNGSPGAYSGSPGDSGKTPDSTVVSGSIITNNTSGYPPQNGSGWTSGGGGPGGNSTDKSYNSGASGNNGFVLVYFSL